MVYTCASNACPSLLLPPYPSHYSPAGAAARCFLWESLRVRRIAAVARLVASVVLPVISGAWGADSPSRFTDCAAARLSSPPPGCASQARTRLCSDLRPRCVPLSALFITPLRPPPICHPSPSRVFSPVPPAPPLLLVDVLPVSLCTFAYLRGSASQ